MAEPIQSEVPLSENLRVPFMDLAPMNLVAKERILDRIGRTIDSGAFTNGDAVEDFESEFARYTELRHCVGLSSGLDALRLALIASGLAADAGVIVPAGTFAATFEAVLQAGGTPVVVDVTEADYNLDVDQVESVVARASHILPVHLYGQLADMRRLSRLAEANQLQIIEDACQAHGARRDRRAAGALSRAAAFSFYPAKNLGAMGDAGALASDDAELTARVRALRVHGETRKYHHEFVGYTARLDTVQAVVLLEKLPFLSEWNRQRGDVARYYAQSLADLEDVALPQVPAGSEPVWHLYVIRVLEPDLLASFLAARGIQTARHYPEPPHLAPAYRALGFAPGDFPVAERLAKQALSLPLYPGIAEAQLEWVSRSIRDYFQLEARRQSALRRG